MMEQGESPRGNHAKTALDRLDDAIHEYLVEVGELSEGVALQGWQLNMEMTRLFHADGIVPLASKLLYAFGPQTTLGHALGLAAYGAAQYRAAAVGDD